MEPEGTSRDDLDVRLNWPGAEPERAAATPDIEAGNGASITAQSEQLESESPPVTLGGNQVSSAPGLESLRTTMAMFSARLEALTSAVEGMRVVLWELVDQQKRAQRGIDSTLSQSNERVGASLAQIHEKLAQVAGTGANPPDQVLARLNELAYQTESLRRRMTLKARADQALSPEAIQLIAETVAERLSNEETASSKGTRSRPGQRSPRT